MSLTTVTFFHLGNYILSSDIKFLILTILFRRNNPINLEDIASTQLKMVLSETITTKKKTYPFGSGFKIHSIYSYLNFFN